MKKIITMFICFAFLFEKMNGKTELTPIMIICRNIEMGLWDDGFLAKGKNLPESFEDIPSIRQIMEENPESINLLNSLSIVPGAPLIQSDPGIYRSRRGARLFAISRTTNFDYAKPKSQGGRFCIIIPPDGKSALPNWVDESEVKIILNQLNDFDPTKQPLAFEDLKKSHDEAKPTENNWEIIEDADSQKTSGARDNKRNPISAPDENPSNNRFWIPAGIAFLLLMAFGWIKLKKPKT